MLPLPARRSPALGNGKSMKNAAVVIASLALLVLASVSGYLLGQRNMRSEYEIARSSSSAIEGQLVEIGQHVKILHEIKGGDARSGERMLLGQIQYGLQVIDTLVPFAGARDKELTHQFVQELSHQLPEFRPPTNAVPSRTRDSLIAVYHREVEETIASILKKTSKTNLVE